MERIDSHTIEGLKYLSRGDIEKKVEEIFSLWFPEYLEKPKIFAWERFCAKIQKEYKVKVTIDANLGNGSNGYPILGAFSLNPREIFVDKSIRYEKRFLFVLAHEIGHLILHRNLKFSESWNNKLTDTHDGSFTSREQITPSYWLEWQANMFAVSLLLPECTFLLGFLKAQQTLKLPLRQKIYVNGFEKSINEYQDLVSEMARRYYVSKTMVKIRLNEFGLVEGPGVTIGHISKHLS